MKDIFGHKKFAEDAELPDVARRMDAKTREIDKKIAQVDEELASFKAQLANARGSAQKTIKQRALQALKRKKMYEAQRDSMISQAFNVEQASFALELSRNAIDTASAMKAATVQLHKEQKKLTIDDVESEQDNMADLMQDLEEIQQTLGRSYGIGEDINEADLEVELADLDEECATEANDSVNSIPSRPIPSYLQTTPITSKYDASVSGSNNRSTQQRTEEYNLPLAPVAHPTVS